MAGTRTQEDELFDDDFRYFHEVMCPPERTEAEVRFINGLIHANRQGSMSVLDLGCGWGRLTNRLASPPHNFDVLGVDVQDAYLRSAEADGPAEYVRQDIRHLDLEREFDVVINWNTGFSYYSDEVNESILRRAADHLVPGGLLLLDIIAYDYIVRDFREFMEVRRGDDVQTDRLSWDAPTSRLRQWRDISRDGRRSSFFFETRLYPASEMHGLLGRVGLTTTAVLDERGADYSRDSSRLVVAAVKRSGSA